MIQGFTDHIATIDGARVAYSVGGPEGSALPPILLLHGFPQTRAMWGHIAPELAKDRRVICADLRGYGESEKPQTMPEHSFRAMGADLLGLMSHLGHRQFDLVGHDRGARTAHRMALDAPERIRSLTVMDIVPTHLLLDDLNRHVAKGYYHWFFLAQPAPFPETMILHDPDAFYESCLLGWGAARLEDFDPAQLEAYRAAWRDPAVTGGMCNDYRAALAVDFDHDAADLARPVTCPALVLYGAEGAMASAYDVPATWAARCTDMRADAITGGHFFPDTNPAATLAALKAFLPR